MGKLSAGRSWELPRFPGRPNQMPRRGTEVRDFDGFWDDSSSFGAGDLETVEIYLGKTVLTFGNL